MVSYHLYAFQKQPKLPYNARSENISYSRQIWIVGSERERV